MSSIRQILRLGLGLVATAFATQTNAAVRILEGNAPAASTPSPTAPANPADVVAPQPAPPPPVQPVQPSNHTAAPSPQDTARIAPPPADAPSPAPDMLDLAGAVPANPAEFSVEMLPSQTVSIGSVVSFKVSSKKPGYVVLMDVDAAGHLTQIYPYTASLSRTDRVNGNYIKPGVTLTIPVIGDPYAGVRYVVSPPNGHAMIVGILSASPVQILDLPDVPAAILDKPNLVMSYLWKRTNELRIPGDGNQLHETKWSFNAQSYTIQ